MLPPEVAKHPESIPVLRCGRCSFATMQALIWFSLYNLFGKWVSGLSLALLIPLLGLTCILNDFAQLLLFGMVVRGCKCKHISPHAFVDLCVYDFPSLNKTIVSRWRCLLDSVWSQDVPRQAPAFVFVRIAS